MSERAVWKLVHLLYLYGGREGLDFNDLQDAGVGFDPRAVHPLIRSGIIEESNSRFKLTDLTSQLLTECVVANQRTHGVNMYVDYPRAFVAMPFSEAWSDDVYRKMIEPAIKEDSGLECIRGDEPSRVGNLDDTIWKGILHSGIIVVDISVPNVNVFYELGITHAIGKDTLILKQKGSDIPADISGSLYVEYDLNELDIGRVSLSGELIKWSKEVSAQEVKKLEKRMRQIK